MTNILFIEDNKVKAEEIIQFCKLEFQDTEIVLKESFTSGLREFFINDYDILLLDMSLPTRDGLQSSSLNNFEQLGGYKIMSEMKRKNRIRPTIMITMFSEFGFDKSFMDLKQLDSLCADSFPNFYKGLIFYSSRNKDWKFNILNKLSNLI